MSPIHPFAIDVHPLEGLESACSNCVFYGCSAFPPQFKDMHVRVIGKLAVGVSGSMHSCLSLVLA